MKSIRTLVIGLGNLGDQLVKNIQAQTNKKFDLICALDDDPGKEKLSKEFGFEQFAATSCLEEIVNSSDIEYIIIAITNANARFLNDLMYRCLKLEVRTKYVTDEYTKLDELEYFNTPIIEKNLTSLKEFNGSAGTKNEHDAILVTGGGGYIGNHLVRDLLSEGYKVVVLDSFIFKDHALKEDRKSVV